MLNFDTAIYFFTMGQEIERKYLVKDDSFRQEAFMREKIKQGYLTTDPDKTVRVRTRNQQAFLTIKGKTNGITRAEFEYEIPYQDALEMMSAFCEAFVEKTRYYVKYDGFTWEVDEFYGDNKGLLLAEIELESVNATYDLPPWAGEEVSGNKDYYNARLLTNPYKNWKKRKG